MKLEPNLSELLNELPKLAHGQALLKFLEEEKKILNDVKTLTSWEEALGRKNAIKIIDDLFSFMGEKKVETKSRNTYV